MRVHVTLQFWILAMVASAASAQNDIAERAKRIHADAFVMDTHTDTTTKFEDPEWDFAERHEEGHVDLPRLREGGYDAVFWAIWMGKTPRHCISHFLLIRYIITMLKIKNQLVSFIFLNPAVRVRSIV